MYLAFPLWLAASAAVAVEAETVVLEYVRKIIVTLGSANPCRCLGHRLLRKGASNALGVLMKSYDVFLSS